jgi:hypothetical protein
MFDREENEIVTLSMAGFVQPMQTLRNCLVADGLFDAVALWAKSERWPEKIGIGARNKLWALSFECDSNEVCRLYLHDLTRRAPRARSQAGFFFTGLLKSASVGPLCEGVRRVVQELREFLQSAVQSDLDEAHRQRVHAAFEEHTIGLDNFSLLPLSGFNEEDVASLASRFMNDNPHIFNHPRADVRSIYRAGEVREWLLARSDAANADTPELKLLRYCVFRTVQRLCDLARAEEAYLRWK